MSVDLEQLAGIKNGSFFVHGWGGWTDSEGTDGTSIGSVFGSSAVGAGNRGMDIVEAFYEGSFFFDNLTIALGKMDFTGTFDASEYADDECGQFLNAAFVDDPTIPFPAQGLGVVLNWDITDTWYLMGGVIDAQGDSRETGFRTAFHKEDYYFYAIETGKSIELNSARGALPGNYRVGMWIDGQDKARLSNDKNYRDDIGVYTSCDQVLYKENGDPEDTQGLAAFLRYGWASSKYNEITKFFSAGVQYQGLVHSRDDDVVGLGFAHGTFSNDSSYTDDYESVWEVYYNAQITPWLAAGPSLQYISNPGGESASKDAVVVGFRAAVTF
jgi:porin